MGDSICFRAEILRKLGWGEGLTEDYQLRQRLLLEGIRIEYEPEAIGLGEAPLNWQQARAQRARWLRGTRDASQTLAPVLLKEGLRRRDVAILEGAFQAYFPSYSTLTVIAAFFLVLTLIVRWIGQPVHTSLLTAWIGLVVVLFMYPFGGLLLERAPLKAYLAILTGPFFIFWRTLLALQARLSRKPVEWIRTAHGQGK
jgi:cellulose synthase/poly-beta-1,6-N-acetylglucosamine synthase-like glycosyltransferase